MQRTRSRIHYAVALMACFVALVALVGFVFAQTAAENAPKVPPVPTRPAPPPPAPTEPTPKAKPGEAVAPLLRENTRLIDRTGRILSLSEDLGIGAVPRSVFQPNGELGYYILLENSLLQKLEDQTRHGERAVLISGTVTEYRGQNFLLLTRVFVHKE